MGTDTLFSNKKSSKALILLMMLFLLPTLLCTNISASETKVPSSQEQIPNEVIKKGIHFLYNRQFIPAERLFEEVKTQFPDKPIGYFYMAMVTWSRLAAGFWSPETVSEYEQRIERTINIATKRIESGNAGSFDYFYFGGALGFMARFKLMKEEWLSSFFLARKAVDALNTCLEMDPDNKDVLFGLGTFDYYTARFSGVLKFLSYLLVHHGDKERGLRRLNIAAEEARYSATEAKSMLLHIYLFLEEDFNEAFKISEELQSKYDQNPRFKLLLGVCAIRLDREKVYEQTLIDLHNKTLNSSTARQAGIWERRVLYLKSVHDLFHKNYGEARNKLSAILSRASPDHDPEMIAWPLIKTGMSYDLEGQREKAEDFYRRILEMKNGAGAQFLAEKFLDKAPEENDPFIGY